MDKGETQIILFGSSLNQFDYMTVFSKSQPSECNFWNYLCKKYCENCRECTFFRTLNKDYIFSCPRAQLVLLWKCCLWTNCYPECNVVLHKLYSLNAMLL